MDIIDWLQGLLQGATPLVIGIVVVIIVVIIGLVIKSGYKIADANEVLVITGGKGMRIVKSGGAYVSFLRKYTRFSLGNMTLRSDEQETQTSTKVPIVVLWTAQIRPDTVNDGALEKAVIGYIGYKNEDEIKDSLKSTLDGEIRQVVATMTPDEVIVNKEGFSSQVTENVSKKMTDLGFELVTLNIAEVSDRQGYYANLAAEDRESKRQNAETLTANANQAIAVAQAKADQVSESAVLDKQLVVAEKGRDVALKQAGFDQETAAAQGQVTVVRAQQERAAAIAQQEVAVTEAETARKTVEIQAQSTARKSEIDAEASATVAKTNATAEAEAAAIRAKGESDAIALKTQAQAEQTRAQGQAEADAAKARGEAEAAAILARGRAEAETERLMADALSANEGANKEIRLAEIDSTTRITIATESAKVMGSIGEKVTIIDMGGSSQEGGSGGLLTNFLSGLPAMMQQADIKSQLLNGVPLTSLLGSLAASMRETQQGPGMPVGLRPQTADKPADAPAPAADADTSVAAPSASVEVSADAAKVQVPLVDDVAEPGFRAFSAEDAVEGLQAAAEAAPEILEHAQGIRNAVKPGKRASGRSGGE